MDVPSLLLLLALLIPVALFVARPLFARASTSVSETTQRASALLAERERVLAALQELDFDHVVGKIPEEEYPSRRAALVTEGVAVLKQLDEVEETTSNFKLQTPKRQTSSVNLEDALEEAVARAREPRPSLGNLDALLESAVASARHQPSTISHRPREAANGFCPNCGKPGK